MKSKIIIKFRENISLTENLKEELIVPDNYYKEVSKFEPSKKENSDKIDFDIEDFIKILNDNALKVQFIHSTNKIDTINKIKDRILAQRKKYNTNVNFKMPNLYNVFQIETKDEYDAKNILGIIKKFATENSILEYVYIQKKTKKHELLDELIDEIDRVLEPAGNQDYLNTMSINNATWNIGRNQFHYDQSNAAKGENIILIDLEDNWNVQHPEFQSVPNLIFPLTNNQHQWTSNVLQNNHGTNILGVLISQHGNVVFGEDFYKGICPNATVKLSSIINQELDEDPYEALLSAIDNAINPGSIILIPKGFWEYPFELDLHCFDIITVGIAANICIIESAGNSGKDLKELQPAEIVTYLSGVIVADATEIENFSNRFYSIQSGAIIVGSCFDILNLNSKYDILASSNHDTRSQAKRKVKIFAQGLNIRTTDNGNSFKSDFSSTSGAGAIIAGIVVSLQGIAKYNNKFIPPDKMLAMLSKSSNGIAAKIGTKTVGYVPNYQKLVNQLVNELNNLPNI